MMELLAIPAWDTPPTSLEDWLRALEAAGLAARSVREPPNAWWIEVPGERLRGYAAMQGEAVEAINFEFHAPDHDEARGRLALAAGRLGWELHEDDDEDDEDDDEAP